MMVNKIYGIGNTKVVSSSLVTDDKKTNTKIATKQVSKEVKDTIEIQIDPSKELEYKWKLHGNRFNSYATFSGHYTISMEIKKLCQDYIDGNKTVQDLTNEFNHVVGLIHDFDQAEGIAAKEDAAHYGKIVSDTCRWFQQLMIEVAFDANQSEGMQVADQYGTQGNRNFLYYNADYYYLAQEANDRILQQAEQLAAQAGTSVKISVTGVKWDTYENFNTYWKHQASCQSKNGDLMDSDLVPPKGFQVFYKESRYSKEERQAMIPVVGADNPHLYDGVLKVSYGEWSVEGSIDLGYGEDKFLGSDGLSLLNGFATLEPDSPIRRFLANFNFHRRFYGEAYQFRRGYF